jgi:Helix-hairpin-helix motif
VSRSGRLRPLWTLVPPLTLGWLSGPAFLYAGFKARHDGWKAAGIAFLATGVGGFALLGDDGGIGGDGTVLTLGTWVVSSAYALAVRRRYLARVGPAPDPRLLAAEGRLAERERALGIAREDPVRARALGIGRPDLPEAYDGGLVDLNHAPAESLATLPRVDPPLAERLVAVREELGGFVSLEDAGELLDLPPATVERLRGLVVCLPYA